MLEDWFREILGVKVNSTNKCPSDHESFLLDPHGHSGWLYRKLPIMLHFEQLSKNKRT